VVERQRLDQLVGKIPDKLILKAKQAFIDGDNDKADQLFTQVEEQAHPHIAAAAEAAFQRGKLAEDTIQYNDALNHYHRSNQLIPNNSDYLGSLGTMFNTLGEYDKAITYQELALVNLEKILGNNHSTTKMAVDNSACVIANRKV